MVATPNSSYISPEDYFKGEETSPIKYEYRQGQVYAMAGASNAHVIISLNIASMLRNHLRGSGCQEDIIYLASVDFWCAVADFYEDVTFESP
ncbi:MAG: Uma2 family endonuclease [Nostoc sp.]|uniref:Uma2 family endonuclease n=1 Tax=Nostoc sp. TaxID=1180 RepID=UPI002FFAB64E